MAFTAIDRKNEVKLKEDRNIDQSSRREKRRKSKWKVW